VQSSRANRIAESGTTQTNVSEKKELLMKSRIGVRPAVLARTLLIAVAGFASAGAFAQSPIGPRAAPAPSYGAPTSPLLQGYGTRTMTPISLGLTVSVPVASLAPLLPPGFSPLPLAADPTRTSLSLTLTYQVNVQYLNPPGSFLPGTYGPYNGMTISASVLNSVGQTQVLALAGYANNQEIVDINNAAVAAGTSRYADITFTVKDVDGLMRLHAVARDPDTGLVVNVEVSVPPVVGAQLRNLGPFVSSSVVLGQPATIAGLAYVGISSDGGIPVLPELLDLQAMRLKFVSGKILDAIPLSASISWNTEGFFKHLP
jgi:hypothetical protein